VSASAWLTVLSVALGGALGSVARYGVGIAGRTFWPGWPLGTFFVNVSGSFAIGVLFGLFLLRPAPDWVRFGLITGVLGGFTTFSAFSLETLEMLRVDGALAASIYVVATLVMGLGACALGLWVARSMLA
jgi:CrcB protein